MTKPIVAAVIVAALLFVPVSRGGQVDSGVAWQPMAPVALTLDDGHPVQAVRGNLLAIDDFHGAIVPHR
ncbi:hypothetical protein [Micromonospora inyonensis]|uniref:hypothetical protein n=1 Tax=Micromonospora inyonensis TaxID=47866 RepID=UPI000B8263E0|nr:hypothetical protein [Micromonospora inyonensis]